MKLQSLKHISHLNLHFMYNLWILTYYIKSMTYILPNTIISSICNEILKRYSVIVFGYLIDSNLINIWVIYKIYNHPDLIYLHI